MCVSGGGSVYYSPASKYQVNDPLNFTCSAWQRINEQDVTHTVVNDITSEYRMLVATVVENRQTITVSCLDPPVLKSCSSAVAPRTQDIPAFTCHHLGTRTSLIQGMCEYWKIVKLRIVLTIESLEKITMYMRETKLCYKLTNLTKQIYRSPASKKSKQI